MADNDIDDFENEVCPLLQTMNALRTLNLKNNPVCQIPKYRDQIVLLSRSVNELDGKDVTEHERKYLVNLISRKKVQGTVYKDLKEKKQKFNVDGKEMKINMKAPRQDENNEMLSFKEFCMMYGKGTDPTKVDDDFADYLQYQEITRQKMQANGLRGAGGDLDEFQAKELLTRSKNINGATDFTAAGGANAYTGHVPRDVRRAGN